MGPVRVLVVGEAPSLGRALADRLEAEGMDVRLRLDGDSEAPEASVDLEGRLLVVASPGPYCRTARAWLRGSYPGVPLVVVASRDPLVAGSPQIEAVDLPLRVADLLETVQRAWARGAGSSTAPGAAADPKPPIGPKSAGAGPSEPRSDPTFCEHAPLGRGPLTDPSLPGRLGDPDRSARVEPRSSR